MFAQKGYHSPMGVMLALYKAEPRNCEGDELLRCLNREFWEFAGTVDQIYLMGPTGEIITGLATLAMTSDPNGREGYHFSITSGRLGFFDNHFPKGGAFKLICYLLRSPYLHARRWYLISKVKAALGQFAGIAVLFTDEQLQSYMNSDQEKGRDLARESEVANAIVQSFDLGRIYTKSEAKDLFGMKLSARGFARSWSRASEMRPQLSKPGRRSISGF